MGLAPLSQPALFAHCAPFSRRGSVTSVTIQISRGDTHHEERDMKLACEGCDAVLEKDTAEALHAAMMAHGEEVHSNFFQGKSPDEIQGMKKMMDAHVHQMIADQN